MEGWRPHAPVEAFREETGEGRIALVGEEQTLPYHRPALSKRYLRGELTDTPHVYDEAFYREHDVDLLLGRPVTGVDPSERTLTLSNGDRLRYGKLLLATGARPRALRVAGTHLDGVFNLRTVADSTTIRDAAGTAERAVVVGGGFIGMEAASSLRQLGLGVTLIHLGTGLFDALGSPELSAELAQLYRADGVRLLLGEQVARFEGEGRLTAVTTASGRRVPADLSVVGVGVVPNVEPLDRSGISVDDGIVVDERFETNVPGVFAARDVARFLDPPYGTHRRIEHWSNASYQGGIAGRILAGADVRYDTVSSFFTEVFGTTIRVFGDVARFDSVSAEGSLADGLLASYVAEGRLVGVLTAGQPEEVEVLARQLIAERAPAGALAGGVAHAAAA